MGARDRTNITALLDEVPSFSKQNRGGIFLVIKGPDRGESVRLQENKPVYFGSSPTCEMMLTDKTVSRRHMSAELVGDEVIVRDNDSTNGTFIQGSRFKEINVGFGAEVKLGRTVVKFLPDEEIVEPEPSTEESFGHLLGSDTKMRQMFKLLQDVAATDATVLIEGETGTGKELIAEELHYHSHRRNGPFVVFDCGAVPRELIESALFGHVKGSFTGAVKDSPGLFQVAEGGTFFLDEVCEMPDINCRPRDAQERLERLLCSRFGIGSANLLLAGSLKELVYAITQALRPGNLLVVGPAIDLYRDAAVFAGSHVEFLQGRRNRIPAGYSCVRRKDRLLRYGVHG